MNKTLLVVIIIAMALGISGYFAYKVYTPLPSSTVQVATNKNATTTTTTNQPAAPVKNTPLATIATTTPLSNKATSTPSVATANTISYTDSGFNPNIITVKQGTIVRFENNSAKAMWVIINPESSIKIYPELDQKASVLKGGVFTFAFNKKGTWKIHNHLNGADVATIVVQ